MKKFFVFILCFLEASLIFAVDKETLTVGGFTLNPVEDGYVLSAPCISNFERDELIIKDIQLKGNKILSGGNVELGNENICYPIKDGWVAEIESLCLTDKGLKGRVFFSKTINEATFIYFTFNDFTFFADGNYDTGKISPEEYDSGYICNNFSFEFTNPKYKRNIKTGKFTFEIEDCRIYVPYDDDVFFDFGKATVNIDGTIVFKNKHNSNLSFVSMNGYDIAVESFSFKDEHLVLNGSLAPYSWVDNGAKRIKISNDIILYPDFTAYCEEPADVTCNYVYADWNIKGKGIEFGEELMTIYSNKINFREIELDLGKAVYYPDGSLYDTIVDGQNENIFIITKDSLIKSTRLYDEGLYVSMDVVFPEIFFCSEIDYNSILLHQNGELEIDSTNYVIEHIGSSWDTFSYDFYYLSLLKEGLYIDEGVFNFPLISNIQFSFEGMTINYDGSIEFSGGAYPAKLFNMVLVANKLDINDDILNIEGSISLPKEIPGELSGRTIELDSMKIDMIKGKLLCLEAKLEGDYVIPLSDNVSLLCNGVTLAYEKESPVVKFENASLILPVGFEGYSNKVKNAAMYYNGFTFAFDYDKMGISDIIQISNTNSKTEKESYMW